MNLSIRLNALLTKFIAHNYNFTKLSEAEELKWQSGRMELERQWRELLGEVDELENMSSL